MTTVTLELPDTLYAQLQRRSQQSQQPLETELLRLLPPQLPSTANLPELPLAYQEVITFLGQGVSAQEIINFQLSSQAQERATSLIQQHKAGQLSPAELAELDLYVELENFVALLKMQAAQTVQTKS